MAGCQGTAEIRLWGRNTVFCQSVAHLNENTKCRQLLNGFAISLVDDEKS